MVKISIIIPHWNTYELTNKLMKELSIQKNEEVEIIIVDDSNEKRLDKFNDIATIIHSNEKRGVSYARNYGMDISKGEYIAFIDSDDMITNDYVEILLNEIENNPSDIIYFNWADFNENTITRHPQNYAVWKAIYNRKIVPRFNEKLEFNEDVSFQEEIKNIKHTESFIDRVLYIYNSNREGSQMWRRDKNDKS